MIYTDYSMNQFEDRLLKEEVQKMKFEGVSERKIGKFLDNYATSMYLIPNRNIQEKE